MPPPLIAVCANEAWNLVNFRSGLIQHLIASGFQILAIAPPNPPMEARLRAMGCEFAAVEIDAKGLSPLRDLKTFFALRRLLKQHRPVAWLSWTIKPNVYGSYAAAMLGIEAFPNVSGLGTAFIKDNLVTRIAKLLYRIGFRNAPAVLFQNEDDQDLFAGLHLVQRSQGRLLPGSGIDVEHFAPPSDERPSPRKFLMPSRIVADKGVREFVAAAKMVRTRRPDIQFQLLGALNVANRTAIEDAEVRSWVDDGIVEYLEPVDDVRPFFAKADIVVLPSYREGLSRVLLEAAAMQRPIVTTDVPGCRDVVSDGVNGFLCEARDVESLAEAMMKAAALDDGQWKQMGAASRAIVVERFSQAQVNAIYANILREAGISAPRAVDCHDAAL